MNKDDTVVMIVDMQEYFLRELPEKEREQIKDKQMDILSFAFNHKFYILFVRDLDGKEIVSPLDSFFAYEKCFKFKKQDRNAFSRKDLVKFYEDKEIKNTILAGIYSRVCLLSTAVGAKKYSKIFTCNELMDKAYKRQYWFDKQENHFKTLDELLLKIKTEMN